MNLDPPAENACIFGFFKGDTSQAFPSGEGGTAEP